MLYKLLFVLLFIGTACVSCDRGAKNHKNHSEETLRISASIEPTTLDPRFGRDLITASILKMLYEGLLQTNSDDKIIPALAKEIKVSPDQKTYTFKLRKSSWSNGDPVTAMDFEQTWKSILNPQIPAPNAYQFFMIKGAKAYKEGTGKVEGVGIHAPNPSTLVVELEKPTPYFLKLLTTYFFLPVHETMRTQNPLPSTAEVITNGPFTFGHWKHNNELAFNKNPSFWNASHVKPNRIIIYILDDHTAFQMFERGEIDWVGSPLGTLPQDLAGSLKEEDRLHVAPVAATYWFRFNTGAAPFNNRKLRRAFNLALNRQEIVDHVTQGKQLPALGIVPPSLGLHSPAFFEDNNQSEAWTLFEEALKELKIDPEKMPVVTLTYATSDRMHKIAQTVQQQWKKAFGIEVRLEGLEVKYFNEKVNRFDYQISASNWFADFSDPVNFLDAFKYRTNSSNKTQWEHPDYIKLLDASDHEKDPITRKAILKQAEALLMDQMPVSPLFFATYSYLKNPHISGVLLSHLGLLEFNNSLAEELLNTDWKEN